MDQPQQNLKKSRQQVLSALDLLTEAGLWEAMRARFFREWQNCPPEDWPTIRMKLVLLDDFKAEVRKLSQGLDDE